MNRNDTYEWSGEDDDESHMKNLIRMACHKYAHKKSERDLTLPDVVYMIESFDGHYYGRREPNGIMWTRVAKEAVRFILPESAQAVIDHCRYNAKVVKV